MMKLNWYRRALSNLGIGSLGLLQMLRRSSARDPHSNTESALSALMVVA